MSRTKRGSKDGHWHVDGEGRDYWASHLHPGGEDPKRYTTIRTRKKERGDVKREIRRETHGEPEETVNERD